MDEKCAEDCNSKDAATAFTSGNTCTTVSPKKGHLSWEAPFYMKPSLSSFSRDGSYQRHDSGLKGHLVSSRHSSFSCCS